MKRISVYVRNKKINPSAYYRVYQFLDKIDNIEVKYRELANDTVYHNYHFRGNLFDKLLYILIIFINSIAMLFWDSFIYKPEIVIINREVVPKKMFLLHYLLEKRLVKNTYVIWDIDDALLAVGEISRKEWDLLQYHSDRIIVLSDYLKNLIDTKYRDKVQLLSTTDGDYHGEKEDNDIRKKLYGKEIVLIWMATSSNIIHLSGVAGQLERAAEIMAKDYGKKVLLKCICNKPYMDEFKYLKVENIVWSRKRAIAELKSSHIGIMPLMDDDFTRGKGGFKLIQYMAAGLPVIGSNVGFNKEIVKSDFGYLVDDDGFVEAIVSLGTSYEQWNRKSDNALLEWNEKYSYQSHLEAWKTLLNEYDTN